MKDHGAIISGLREALRKPLPGYDGFLEKAGYSSSEIDAAVDECSKLKQIELHVLGWEWEMGPYDLIVEAA